MSFHFLLVITKTVVVVMGALISLLAFQAYRRRKIQAMLYLSVGFLLITMGSLLEGLFFEFLRLSLVDVYTIDTLIVIGGLSAIIYSIYGASS